MLQNNDYTIDGVGNLYIYQPQKGFRFNFDSLLLYLYSPDTINGGNILDIGAGTGICSFLFADKYPQKIIYSFEIQKDFVQLFKKGKEKNNLDNIKIFCDDINNIDNYKIKDKFSLIVSNPPYRKNGSGRLSPYENKNIAIYDKYLKIDQLLNISNKYLVNNGIFCLFNIYENDKKVSKKIKYSVLNIHKKLFFKQNDKILFIMYQLIKNSNNNTYSKLVIPKSEWKSKINKLYKG